MQEKTYKKLLLTLASQHTVVVHTPYHVHVDGHNLWFSRRGGLKFQQYGNQDVEQVTGDQLLKRLKEYKTGVARHTTDLNRLTALANKAGIFVDAGYRLNSARIAVVRVYVDGDMDITIRHVNATTSHQAEIMQ